MNDEYNLDFFILTNKQFPHTNFRFQSLRKFQTNLDKTNWTHKNPKTTNLLQKIEKIKLWDRPTWHRIEGVANKVVSKQNHFLFTEFRWWHRLLLTRLRWWHCFLPKAHAWFYAKTHNSRRVKNQVRNVKNFIKTDESTTIQSTESSGG